MAAAFENDKVRVRFAPSPTGKLHVGGARTAIFNWAFARANNGVFILRIEDTDLNRSTDENTQVILNALRWMGLDWDEGPEVGGPCEPYFQMERMTTYTDALHTLVENGNAYPCFCSAEKLEADRKAAQERGDSFQGYQRTCRDLDPEEVQRRIDAGEPHVWRVKVPLDRGDVLVHDAVHGDVVFNAKELDDFVLVRSDGTPTYNFCVVVDDINMGITHVIRGDDHLSNTPRQVMVYEGLGAKVPEFAHISMILGSDGKKLSKRHGATSVEEYRDAGYLPDAFLNYLALLGWSLDDKTTIVPRDVLMREFSLDHVSKNPAIMDPEKLDWMNAQYLAAMNDAQFAQEVLLPQLVSAGLEKDGAPAHDSAWYELLASILKPRTKKTVDVVDMSRFLYAGDSPAYDEKSVAKNLKTEDAPEYIEAALTVLGGLDSWKAADIDAALEPLPEQLEAGKRQFYGAIRVAVCGNQVSPPLGESMELLGKDCVLIRLENSLDFAG